MLYGIVQPGPHIEAPLGAKILFWGIEQHTFNSHIEREGLYRATLQLFLH